MKKELKQILKEVESFEIFGTGELSLRGLTDDSRSVEKEFLFVAIAGLKVDAHKFIPKAIQAGAVVVVGEKEPDKTWLDKITYIKVSNSRQALGLLASAWYGHPSKKLKVIGVTGTDGKTTTATLIYWILKKAGKKVGLISTVSAKIGEKEFETGLHVTNPEPLKLQEFLAKMVKKECKYVVLEVTSHGLDQERVAGIDFDVSVLTNITREHLDYHKTFENYIRTKTKLFINSKVAILNKEDKSYGKIKRILPKTIKVLSYDSADLTDKLKDVVVKRFPEKFNQLNATAAISVARVLKISNRDLLYSIKTFPGISGRMQEVETNKEFKVFIDFAHTPNALENVLSYLRKQPKNRLIVVFGCAGERDKEKRPLMGEVSAKLADISVFTAEDPRGENVNEIIMQMVKGAFKTKTQEFSLSQMADLRKNINRHWFIRIPERGEAISYAIQKLAKANDIVVVCGKGHEKSMAYNNTEYNWSDKEAVRIALRGGVKKIKR